MNFSKITLSAIFMLVLVTSCKKEDDSNSTPFVEADRTEQQLKDADSLIGYLETHFYNSSAFTASGDYHVEDIIIEELPKDPATGNYLPLPDPTMNTLLIDSDALETRVINFLDVNYTYYVLRLNQGGGGSPHFSDILRVKYSGMTQDGEIFDSAVNSVDLPFIQANGSGVIEGWKIIMPQFNAASSFIINEDNTTTYSNSGLGVMFLPSGLAYYSTPPISLPLYSNLIFKFEVLQFDVADHDNDGVPTFIEDLNDNRNVFDDDTDGDQIPNTFDMDDDNDGVATINELMATTYVVDTNQGEVEPVLAAGEYKRSRTVIDGVITLKTVKIMDTNGNSIGDYLESGITENYND